MQSTFVNWGRLAVVTVCLKRKLINTDMKWGGGKRRKRTEKGSAY